MPREIQSSEYLGTGGRGCGYKESMSEWVSIEANRRLIVSAFRYSRGRRLKRHKRNAKPLATVRALALLISAATAHAKGAWVLWKHSYEVWVDSNKVDHRRDVACGVHPVSAAHRGD